MHLAARSPAIADICGGGIGRLGPRAVSADEIVAFAAKYDPQPFHVDAKAAEESFFGNLIASGWQANAMVMGLLADCIKTQALAILGAPGICQYRWLAPARPGDVLSGRGTVMATLMHGSTGRHAVPRQAGPGHGHDTGSGAEPDRHNGAGDDLHGALPPPSP